MIRFSESRILLFVMHHGSRALFASLIVFGAVISSVDAEAQDLDITGTAWVTDWPETTPARTSGKSGQALDYSRYNLLPFIDSLAVHYRFSSNSSSESLSMHFAIEWVEGQYGIVAGRKVEIDKMPPGLVIESLDLTMKVIVENEPVAEFFLPLDTIGLGPAPSMTFIDIEDVDWNLVFVDTDEKDARQIFESGFQLSAPRIVRAIFIAEPSDDYPVEVAEGAMPSFDPLDRTVFIPDINIWIDWRDGRTQRLPPPGSVHKTGTRGPRESGRAGLIGSTRISRGLDRSEPGGTDRSTRESPTSTDEKEASEDKSQTDGSDSKQDGDESQSGRNRTAERGGGRDVGKLFSPKKDDNDDDEDRLYPAALAGVAMIGGLAILGGTVGYFGSASKAPIGLMSGYVEPNWGVLLHVAINQQVFGNKKGPENLVAGVTGFYNVFNSQIQPAIGFGTRITEEGTDSIIWKPSVSLGFVGNFGQLVLLAGYDLTTPDFRFGIGVNLRQAK